MYSITLVGYDKKGIPHNVAVWWDDDKEVREKIIDKAFQMYDKFKFYKVEKRIVGFL